MQKGKKGLIACLVTLLLALASAAQAETVTVTLLLSPTNEVPPITNLNAGGGFQITFRITRDANGAITAAAANFLGTVTFPGSVTITGLHIHRGASNVNGPVVIGTDLSGTNSLTFASGTGLVNKDVATVDVAVMQELLTNPAGFYVNLHTTTPPFPGGAIRGQLTKVVETLAVSVPMTTANEVPPITTATASGTGTLTFNPTRNPATGAVTGGTATFTVDYDIPPNSVITGLHIHEGPAGMNAGVVIDTRVGGANTITTASGKGQINIPVPLTTAAQIGALSRLLNNPVGFYVNLHTMAFPGGIIRSQLATLTAPPVVQLSDTHFLPTGTAPATIRLLVTGAELTATAFVNGQIAPALLDISTGLVGVQVPAAALANPGVVTVQIRNSNGLTSTPYYIVVGAAASVNTVVPVAANAASFARNITPEGIATIFGTRLASNTVVGAGTLPLPTSLDGTQVFINGRAMSLFFVSPGQINFLTPLDIFPGPAEVVVLARDGSISRGPVTVVNTQPAFFTFNSMGTGAPAAVASADGGATFPVLLGNAAGVPTAIQAGNVVAAFGTGLRFKSTDVQITAGGVNITPSFVGAQGALLGLDQINFTIPQALAGRGELDLVLTLDAKTSNTVRIRVQ